MKKIPVLHYLRMFHDIGRNERERQVGLHGSRTSHCLRELDHLPVAKVGSRTQRLEGFGDRDHLFADGHEHVHAEGGGDRSGVVFFYTAERYTIFKLRLSQNTSLLLRLPSHRNCTLRYD